MLALVALSSSFFDGDAASPTASKSAARRPAVEPAPVLLLKVKAGTRLIEVLADAGKERFVFQPFIERDDDALMTVLRTIIESQSGEPVAHVQYINNETPPWLLVGAPGHQFRVMIFKDSSNGEVYGAAIKRS